jgi:hypothetical protein
LEQVYKAQFAEMCQQIDAQKSKMEKMMEEFKYMSAEEYSKMFKVFETKKAKLKAHFKENKDVKKVTLDRVLEMIEKACSRFDFSASLDNYVIREEQIYKSDSAVVMDWEFPAKKDLSWDNPLKAIVNGTDSCQFNFVFRNGQKSSLATNRTTVNVAQINPPDAVVRKIIVHYD